MEGAADVDCAHSKKKKKRKKIGKLEKENLDRTSLQCVDDIFPAIKTESKCLGPSVSLLNFLGLFAYRVSEKMAQIDKEAVIYFSFEISQEKKNLRKQLKRSHLPDSRNTSLLRYSQMLSVMDCQLWGTGKTLARSSAKNTWYRLLRGRGLLKP